MQKNLVLDTSVLLYDKTSIHSLPGNNIVIPLVVLEELDRFKEKPGLLGESARYVNRYLDGLRSKGKLCDGVYIEDIGSNIRIITDIPTPDQVPIGLDPTSNDNLIIAAVLKLIDNEPEVPVRLITKDINLRVKCDALGINSEDYYKDHIEVGSGSIYTGISQIDFLDNEIDQFFEKKSIDVSIDCLYDNEYIIGKGTAGGSFLGRYQKGTIRVIPSHASNKIGFEAKNKEQTFAIDLLMDPTVELVTLSGIAGSGKTYITLMTGLEQVFNDHYERIIVTRSIQPVGRDLGYLPGDVNDKMAPWMSPIYDNIRYAFKDMEYFEMMQKKGMLEIAPLSYMRGRTFNNSFLIVDEAQNATIHELKTIITRVGKGSKIVLLGDIDQIDTPYIDKKSNGLSIVIERLKDTVLAGHVQLSSGQRSGIANLATQKL